MGVKTEADGDWGRRMGGALHVLRHCRQIRLKTVFQYMLGPAIVLIAQSVCVAHGWTCLCCAYWACFVDQCCGHLCCL